MNQWTVRMGATMVAAGLVGLSAGPAMAAAPVAQATAGAVIVSAAGNPTGSGTYKVTNDGNAETAYGNNKPPVSVLTGQSFLSAGTLAQDAQTSVVDGAGHSVACAGLAGDGAGVVSAGTGRCLTPGDNLSLQAGSLDLSSLQVVDSTVLMGLDQQLQAALAPVLAPVVSSLQTALQTGIAQLGDPGLFLNLGAVQGVCAATPGAATGDADLADVAAYVQVGGTRVDLLSLPVHPAPNTPIVTGLDKVAVAIEDALEQQLNTALGGALGPLAGVIDQAAVLDNVLAQISTQLAPLDQNVLTGTLNKQDRPTADSIAVTALDLQVLPAAKAFVSDSLVHLQVGQVTCGPSGRVAAPVKASPTPTPKPTPTFKAQPVAVPTAVPAGVASATPPGDDSSPVGSLALGGLLVVAAGAGVASYRRSLRS